VINFWIKEGKSLRDRKAKWMAVIEFTTQTLNVKQDRIRQEEKLTKNVSSWT
jgi:hypothetical protein